MDFKFPDVGEGIEEGKIVKLHIKEGDTVSQDQVIAEVETDKAVVEIPIPKAGVVSKINFNEGDVIHVGDVFLTVGSEAESSKPPEEKTEQPEEKKEQEEKKENTDSSGVVGSLEVSDEVYKAPEKVEQTSSCEIKALPVVRNLAKKLGIDLCNIQGSGPNGSITVADLTKSSPQSTDNNPSTDSQSTDKPKVFSKRKYDMWGYIDREAFAGMRKAVANQMIKTKDSVMVTHCDEADITDLYFHREEIKQSYKDKGIKMTFLPFIIKALVHSIDQYPLVNSELQDEIIIKKYKNIGIAVDTGDGLVVPVVKRCENKDLEQYAKEIVDLAVKAKEKKLNPMDMKGGSITITNIGSIGGLFFTPVLNHPESTIIGLGKIHKKVLVRDNKPEVRVVLPLSITFDHRVMDGAYIANFTNELISKLQDVEFLK